MAITDFNEYKREGGPELKKFKGFLVPRFHGSRHFEVLADTPNTYDAAIYEHASCPKLYTSHPEYPGAICKSVKATQDEEHQYRWEVVAEYDDDWDESDTDEFDSPFSRPAIIRGVVRESEMICTVDVNGTPVRNSARDPFDPPLTRKGGNLAFTITKNFPNLNWGLLWSYKNAINSDAWLSFSARTVRISNITFERVIENQKLQNGETIRWVYWPHTFEFDVAEPTIGDGTWRAYVLDRGYRTLSSSKYTKILDDDGLPATQPALLNGSGGKLSATGTPVWRTFDIYRELSFTALGLP